MKVLITGGTGFVGPHVVGAVADAGHELKLLVRDSTRSRELPGQPVVGEMTNTVSLQHAVEGVEVVVHLVAIRQGPEEQFKRVMEQGTRDLVSAAKAAGVKRFVLMSALGTGEDTKDLVPYYHGKWEMERLGDVCHITTGKKDVNEGNPSGRYPFFTCARTNTFSDSYSFEGEAILIAGNGEVGNLNYCNGRFEAYQRTYVAAINVHNGVEHCRASPGGF